MAFAVRPAAWGVALVLTLLAVGYTPVATALEANAVSVRSYFGAPLLVEVDVTVPAGSRIEAALADYAEFERAGLNRDELEVVIDVAVVNDAGGRTRIVLTTRGVVREPALALLLAVRIDDVLQHVQVEFLLDQAPSSVAVATDRPGAVVRSPTANGVGAVVPLPGPRPARDGRSVDSYGPTARFDTLYAIAAKVRPSRQVSVRAMAMALFEANPHAFFGNNINNLRRGVVLEVPPVRAANSQASRRESAFERQMQAWEGRTSPRSASPSARGNPASPVRPKPVASATPAPRPDGAAAASGAGNTQQAPGPSAGENSGQIVDELTAQIAVHNEAKARSDAAQLALRERLAALDERVAEVRAQLERHSERFRSLHSELVKRGETLASSAFPDASAGSVANHVSSSTDSAEGRRVSAATEQSNAGADESAGPRTSGNQTSGTELPVTVASGAAASPRPAAQANPGTAAATTSKPAASTPVAEARPVPRPFPAPRSDHAPDTSPLAFVTSLARDFTGGVGRVVIVGLVVLVALLAGWVVARGFARKTRQVRADRRHERDEEGLRSQVSQKAARSVQIEVQSEPAGPASVHVDDTEATMNTVDPELAVAPSDESMQALFREVDVYVAYGRFEDAATRLQQAIEDAPGEYELRAKLGEILYEAGRKEEFVDLARSLYLRLQDGGDETLWARLALLGQRLVPDERLFEQSLRAPAARNPEPDYDGVDELAERRNRQA